MDAAEQSGYSRETIRKVQFRESRIQNEKEGFPATVFWKVR
jgi:hypothetical protein